MIKKSDKIINKTEKSNVDDYYTKVDNAPSKEEENKWIKKPLKVRAKKRVFKKKENSITAWPKDPEKVISNVDKRVANLNKRFANMNKEESWDNNSQRKSFSGTSNSTSIRWDYKPFVKDNKDAKKPFQQNIWVVKKQESDGSYKKERDENFNKGYKKPFIKAKEEGSNSTFKTRWEDNNRRQNFGQDKRRGAWKKYDNKKSALKPYNKGRKYNEVSTEDAGFSRSKASTNIKIEKNVEDIKQNLTLKTGEVIVGEILTLKELSEKIGVNLVRLIAEFMKNGMMVNINSKIDFDSASVVAEAFEIQLKKDDSEGLNVEDLMTGNILDLLREDNDAKLTERPPVISIMGHVDHWKTSLLDKIRTVWSNVTDGEAGWITQSIWAYQVEKEGKKITFLDTPGHEAFTVMRARWAKATDIAILVVAADEWVKPQTIESINHAKEAGIPVIVAINKMDKEWANPDHLKGQLAENGLTSEDWGWDTPMIPVSAKTGFGIDELLEIILLTSEMKELKANKNRNWVATIIESHLDSKLGPVSTVLVNTGTISKWDQIVCNESFWKVKILKNFENKNVKIALPWDPVLIVWLDSVVWWWDVVQVVNDASTAKRKAEEYRDIILAKKRNEISGLEVLMSRIRAGNLKQLKIVVKTDSNWSLEALKVALQRLSTPETNVAIIHSWVGNINESDIIMASSSKAILISFNVEIVATAKKTIEVEKVEYIESKVIYHITEKIEKIVSGMLDPKEVDIELGTAKVWGIFYTSKEFMVIGLILQHDNNIEEWAKVRVIRKKSKIGEWKIKSLKSWIEEVKELEGPTECWIKFVWSIQPEMGDHLEIYKTEIHK
jgi:translation initiation factor IF-2